MLTKYFKHRFIVAITLAVLSWLYIVVDYLRDFISNGFDLLDSWLYLFVIPLLYYCVIWFLFFVFKHKIKFIASVCICLIYFSFGVYNWIGITQTLVSLTNSGILNCTNHELLLNPFVFEVVLVYILPSLILLIFTVYCWYNMEGK